MQNIIITTGDPDGIGLEVASKALAALGPKVGYRFILWRRADHDDQRSRRRLLARFQVHRVSNLTAALSGRRLSYKTLVEINSMRSPAEWVATSAHACNEGLASALVTGPLSKTLIRESGMRDLGHTEILTRISKTKSVYMTFLGSKFHVLLATGHVPLSAVSGRLTSAVIQGAIRQANMVKSFLPAKSKKRPIGVLGLNPHAGEHGLIGRNEAALAREILRARRNGYRVEGPLVPDSAFLPESVKKYSLFVALYHDQGLIPFKLVHGFNSGVQFSAGLPFIRTSVDHGTAKNIYGLNKAKYGSMKDAIEWAIRLSRAT